VAVTSKQVAY